MAHQYAPLDAVITAEIDKLVHFRGNFTTRELYEAVRRNPTIFDQFRRLRKRNEELSLDALLERGLKLRIGSLLHKKDPHGFRKYESYRPEGGLRRAIWVLLRSVTGPQIRLIMQTTRVREYSMKLKRERYQIFADRLDQLEEGATLDLIYDDVAPIAARYQTR